MNKKLIAIPVVLIAIIVGVTLTMLITNSKREEMPIKAMEDLTGFKVNKHYDDGVTEVYFISDSTCDISIMYNSGEKFIKSITFQNSVIDENKPYSDTCLKAFGDITKNSKLIAQNDETKTMVTDLAESFVTRSVDDTNIDNYSPKGKVRFVFLDKEYGGDHDINYQLKITRDYNGSTKKAENFIFNLIFKEKNDR